MSPTTIGNGNSPIPCSKRICPNRLRLGLVQGVGLLSVLVAAVLREEVSVADLARIRTVLLPPGDHAGMAGRLGEYLGFASVAAR